MVITPLVIPPPIETDPAVCMFANVRVVAPAPPAITKAFEPEDEPSVMVPV